MIKCENCGAEIENDVEKCPYCGFINIKGAEKKHNEAIDDIKEDMVSLKKEPAKAFKKGLFIGIRIIVITLILLAILAGVFFVILLKELENHPKEFLSPEEEAYASAYRLQAGKQLAEAYENGDIEELARIFDKAYSGDRVNLFGDEHYETARAASYYVHLKENLPNLEKEKIDKHEAEVITYYCFYFYYKAYGEDGSWIFDPIREEEIIPIITDRLGFSEEDMENFRDKVIDPPYVDRTAVYKATKKYFKNYH